MCVDGKYLTSGALLFFIICGSVGWFSTRELVNLLDRTPPVVYLDRDILQHHVKPGDTANVRYTLRRDRVCQSTVVRWLEDSKGQMTEVLQTAGVTPKEIGTYSSLTTITIPDTEAIALGPARYYSTFKSYCSVLQRLFGWPIEFKSPDVRFEIVNSYTDRHEGVHSGG